MSPLLQFTNRGIYCEAGDFYIDPWKPVNRAFITHAHSDHAYRGHDLYLAHRQSIPVLQYRLGEDINVQSMDYNETIFHNGVKISLHPAGHIIGSAQVRVEKDGEVWVMSGDYKLENDCLSPRFEPVQCNVFITESTFGLPIYQWKPQSQIFDHIKRWWQKNQEENVCSIIMCYALGKAQRILCGIDLGIGPVYAHGAIENINEILRKAGEPIPPVRRITPETTKDDLRKALVLATSSVLNTSWLRKLAPFSIGYASGWMQVRGNKRRRAADAGFVLSDHADWSGLNETVKATGAQKVFVTHGFTYQFAKWLREQGLDAHEVKTAFKGESIDETTDETGTESIIENTAS
ncbi:MAG: ligase-associated DNA damage response exonuclease [Chitinophagales bacterium]|nr:ligase-associated DNA damage response exonuclease [Chitinophagales bacterium]